MLQFLELEVLEMWLFAQLLWRVEVEPLFQILQWRIDLRYLQSLDWASRW